MGSSLHLNYNGRTEPVSLLGLGDKSQRESKAVVYAAIEILGLREVWLRTMCHYQVSQREPTPMHEGVASITVKTPGYRDTKTLGTLPRAATWWPGAGLRLTDKVCILEVAGPEQ